MLTQLSNFGEAVYEAKAYDKKHGFSITLQLVFCCLVCVPALPDKWFIVGPLLFVQGRVAFDMVHNWFKGKPASYTGEPNGKYKSNTDKFLEWSRQHLKFEHELVARGALGVTCQFFAYFVALY